MTATASSGAVGPYGQGRAWPLLAGERGHYELAAGGDVETHLRSLEGFSSTGSMLPEQVWDQKSPIETQGGVLNMGDPAGSAMPLAWAHAEYLKLVRSVEDGKVFDLVEPVVARYGQGPKKSRIEMWKRRRPISAIAAGKTLRILAADHFDVVYSLDGWASQQRVAAGHFGAAGAAADIAIPGKGAQELVFTLFWSESQQWEGRNFSVKIDAAPPAAK
jgi:glucoamylase